jgi:elongation factor G
MGDGATASDIPGIWPDAVESARTQLIEAAAEGDDELIMKYLEGEELTAEEINRGLRPASTAAPSFPSSAALLQTTSAIRPLMDALVAFMPDPSLRPAAVGDVRMATR